MRAVYHRAPSRMTRGHRLVALVRAGVAIVSVDIVCVAIATVVIGTDRHDTDVSSRRFGGGRGGRGAAAWRMRRSPPGRRDYGSAQGAVGSATKMRDPGFSDRRTKRDESFPV